VLFVRATPAEAAPDRSQRRAALRHSNEGGGTLRRAILCSVERFLALRFAGQN